MKQDRELERAPPRDMAGQWRQLALPALGILVLMAFLVAARPPGDLLFWRQLFQFGHIPLFGFTALLMLRIVRILRAGVAPESLNFLIALLATAILSLVSEAAQVLQPGRSVDIGDALNNLTGAFCFIGIAAASRPGLWRTLGRDGPMAARLVLIGASLALALSAIPLLTMAWSYAMRQAALPVVADLAASWQQPFLSVGRAEAIPVPRPEGWPDELPGPVVRLTFLDAPWPGFTVREPYPDWTGYEALRFRIWSALESPVEIVLRVDDTHRGRSHADRFNSSFIVLPGMNDFSVPLATVASGPRERTLDLADISQFVLFSRRPEEPFELYFSHVWLE